MFALLIDFVDFFHPRDSDREGFFVRIIGLSLFDGVGCCSVAGDDNDSCSLIKESVQCVEGILLDLFWLLGPKRVVCLVSEKDVVVLWIALLKVFKGLESTKSAVKYPDHGLLRNKELLYMYVFGMLLQVLYFVYKYI